MNMQTRHNRLASPRLEYCFPAAFLSSSSSMAEEQAPYLIIPQIPSLDNTFGAIVIGTYVGLM